MFAAVLRRAVVGALGLLVAGPAAGAEPIPDALLQREYETCLSAAAATVPADRLDPYCRCIAATMARHMTLAEYQAFQSDPLNPDAHRKPFGIIEACRGHVGR